MGTYSEVYEFAARAGAFEGYVYGKTDLDPAGLTRWVEHIVAQYAALPPEVIGEFQDLCDGTIGRAIQSLAPSLGEEHEIITKLRGLMKGKLPSSPDDFSRKG
jgi:hypothetical protein